MRYAGAEADPRPFPATAEHLAAQPSETRGYVINHLMYRIKDPAVSLPFYQDVLGLRSLMTFNTGPFTIYYLSYPEEGGDDTPEERVKNMQTGRGLIELIHVHGTETDADFRYNSGNDLRCPGFGHLGLSVPDVPAAMARFRAMGVDVIKDVGSMDPTCLTLERNDYLPGAGFMGHVYTKIGFVRDPDGYWIEIVPKGGFA